MAAPKRKQITCPSCQHQQMEYVEANSTFCHVCGTRIALQEQDKGKTQRTQRTTRHRLPPKRNKRLCLHCSYPLHIPEASGSWQCPACSGYLDLKDHEISVSAGRSILTYGNITVTPRGRFGGTRLEGSNFTIEGGSVAGQIIAREQFLVTRPCKIEGDIRADHFWIEREGQIENRKSLRCRTARIDGKIRLHELVASESIKISNGARLQVDRLNCPAVEVEQGGRLVASLVEIQPQGTKEDQLPETPLSESASAG